MRTAILTASCLTLFYGSAPLSIAAASDETTVEWKITVVNETPLHRKCYEHARDRVAEHSALAACDRSIETESLSPRQIAVTYANRGVINYNLGDYGGAVDDFTKALDRNIHTKAKIHANRGLSYEALFFDGLARADYEAALAADPDNRTAARRLEELDKPAYERARPPRRITAEAPTPLTSPPKAGI